MSSTVSILWRCERCGATTTTEHGKQPEHWHRISAANPPQHAEPTNQGDLCGPCWDGFCDWWRAAPSGRSAD